MKIADFFLIKSRNESFIIQLKSKILLYLSLAGVGLSIIYFFISVIKNNGLFGKSIMPVLIIIILVVVLILLRIISYKVAGNFISIVLVVSQMISIFPSFSAEQPFELFIDEFYFSVAFLVASALFSTEIVLLFNSIFIIVVSAVSYYMFKDYYSGKTEELAGFAFWNYEFMIITISITLFGIQKIFNKAIEQIKKESKLRAKQNQQMKQVAKKVKISTVNLNEASSQLSAISQQISQNANNQASITEEVSSSMEQILTMINSNIKNAEITGRVSNKSANEMKQSNEIFVKTINMVFEISKKITIISDIANKTDILSINAAIEAARAGKAGKGFSVIAKEIRNLADKTKKVSVRITELSKKGQEISKIAEKKLEKAIPEIIKNAKLVNNIVLAGKEQQSGVENINNSIQQLTEITNENSASAEEMSESAEKLSAQAKQLKELINFFNTNTNTNINKNK